jgi:hypothetical protein
VVVVAVVSVVVGVTGVVGSAAAAPQPETNATITRVAGVCWDISVRSV